MIQNPFNQRSIGFRWVFLAATAMSALVILEDYTGYLINQYEYAYSWFAVPAKALSNYWVWALLAPVFDWQARELVNVPKESRPKAIGLAVLVGLVTALLHRVLAVSVFDGLIYIKSGFYEGLLSEKNQLLIGAGWVASSIQYAIILLLFFAVVYYRQYLQQQKELSQAQLRALKMQVHPHFLFNTLHSIASLIDIDPRAAQKMISQLGGLMRNTLEQEEKGSASLKQEIDYIKNYLDIEYVRFQDRLRIDYQLGESAMNATLPYLILQPLIENAIKHGIQDLREDGMISIEAMREGGRVRLTIADNGAGISKARHGSGLGLSNVRNRLHTFFNSDYELNVCQLEPNGFRVSIEVPYLEFKEA